MSDVRSGSCHCGAVRVTVPASAFGVIACHCSDCQQLHGNYFAMIAVPAADAQVTGEAHVRWYASSDVARRSFCDVCGSRIAKEPVGSGRLLFSVGLFGAETGLRIRKQVWEHAHPDWYTLPATEVAS